MKMQALAKYKVRYRAKILKLIPVIKEFDMMAKSSGDALSKCLERGICPLEILRY